MGRLVLSFFVLAQILLAQAMAARPDGTAEALVRTGDDAHAAGGSMMADPPSSSSSSRSNGGLTESWSEGEAESEGVAQPPGIRRLGRHRHSSDRSVAGGGVIIGGLVTAIFAAVYSYIRVTGRRAEDEKH